MATAETEEMCTGHRSYLAGILLMYQAVKYENGTQILVVGFRLKRKVTHGSEY